MRFWGKQKKLLNLSLWNSSFLFCVARNSHETIQPNSWNYLSVWFHLVTSNQIPLNKFHGIQNYLWNLSIKTSSQRFKMSQISFTVKAPRDQSWSLNRLCARIISQMMTQYINCLKLCRLLRRSWENIDRLLLTFKCEFQRDATSKICNSRRIKKMSKSFWPPKRNIIATL